MTPIQREQALLSMTSMERQEVVEAVVELERRKVEERVRYFVPTKPSDKNVYGIPSNDQLGIYMSPAKFRLDKGGNRSGKTEIAIYDALMFALGLHPVRSEYRKPPVKIRFCAPTFVKNVKILLEKLKGFVPRNELVGGSWVKAWSEKYKTLHFKNVSMMEFLSFEQHVERFAGQDLDACYSDEHGSLRHFRENMARLADRNGYYMQTFTPDEGSATWEKRVFKELVSDGFSFDHFSCSIFGNPHLSKEGIEAFKATLKGDKNLELIKLMGEYAALGGMVYPTFSRKDHVIPEREIPSSWYRMFIIDPHMKKAHGMLWCAVTPDDELIAYRYSNQFLAIEPLKKYIRVKSTGEKISLWMGDEAMGGEGQNIYGEDSVLNMLAKGDNAIPIVGTNQASDKAFEAGVMRLRDMMLAPVGGRPDFAIMQSYKGHSNEALIDEFLDYQFLPEEKADEKVFRERVRKIDDEGPDCTRYAAQSMSLRKTPKIKRGRKW